MGQSTIVASVGTCTALPSHTYSACLHDPASMRHTCCIPGAEDADEWIEWRGCFGHRVVTEKSVAVCPYPVVFYSCSFMFSILASVLSPAHLISPTVSLSFRTLRSVRSLCSLGSLRSLGSPRSLDSPRSFANIPTTTITSSLLYSTVLSTPPRSPLLSPTKPSRPSTPTSLAARPSGIRRTYSAVVLSRASSPTRPTRCYSCTPTERNVDTRTTIGVEDLGLEFGNCLNSMDRLDLLRGYMRERGLDA